MSDGDVQIYVCTTCNDRRSGPGGRAGARLFSNLSDLVDKTAEPGLRVVPVECLSVCRPTCALSFAAPAKWTYVLSVPSDTQVSEILHGALLYAQTETGVIPWGVRPEYLKQGVIARVPPMLP